MRRAVWCLSRGGVLREQWRRTHVFRHAKPLPVTPSGEDQRPPNEKQEYQMYELIRIEDETETPLKIVLNTYVEELGNWGDVVETGRDKGRELILSGDAVYASPYNMEKLRKQREPRTLRPWRYAHNYKLTRILPGGTGGYIRLLERTGSLPPRISLHAMKTARQLSQRLLMVPMNLDNEWILEKWHLKSTLRRQGFFVDEESLVMPKETLIGPDLSVENKLFRFYVLINRQVVVPMIGRLHHVSNDDSRGVMSVGLDPSQVTSEEMREYGISPQKIYIHPQPFEDNSLVWSSEMQEHLKES